MIRVFNKIIAIHIWNDAEWHVLSDQYRLRLKHCQKMIRFVLILDKYGSVKKPMIFCRYFPQSDFQSYHLLEFITKRIFTFFCIGAPINYLEIFRGPNRSLRCPCHFYPYTPKLLLDCISQNRRIRRQYSIYQSWSRSRFLLIFLFESVTRSRSREREHN